MDHRRILSIVMAGAFLATFTSHAMDNDEEPHAPQPHAYTAVTMNPVGSPAPAYKTMAQLLRQDLGLSGKKGRAFEGEVEQILKQAKAEDEGKGWLSWCPCLPDASKQPTRTSGTKSLYKQVEEAAAHIPQPGAIPTVRVAPTIGASSQTQTIQFSLEQIMALKDVLPGLIQTSQPSNTSSSSATTPAIPPTPQIQVLQTLMASLSTPAMDGTSIQEAGGMPTIPGIEGMPALTELVFTNLFNRKKSHQTQKWVFLATTVLSLLGLGASSLGFNV